MSVVKPKTMKRNGKVSRIWKLVEWKTSNYSARYQPQHYLSKLLWLKGDLPRVCETIFGLQWLLGCSDTSRYYTPLISSLPKSDTYLCFSWTSLSAMAVFDFSLYGSTNITNETKKSIKVMRFIKLLLHGFYHLWFLYSDIISYI